MLTPLLLPDTSSSSMDRDIQAENAAIKARLKEVTAANQRLGKALERQKERALMVKEALSTQSKFAPDLVAALSGGPGVKHIPPAAGA